MEQVVSAHEATVRLIPYLVELDQRSSWRSQTAEPSLFGYLVRRLGHSEVSAMRRIGAARVVKRLPEALELLERREVSLSSLSAISSHLTDDNAKALLEAVRGKSKREIDLVIAAYRPEQPRTRESITPRSTGAQGESPKPSAQGLFEQSSEGRIHTTVTTEEKKERDAASPRSKATEPSPRSKESASGPAPEREPDEVRLRFVFESDLEFGRMVEEASRRLSSKYRRVPTLEEILNEANLRLVCRAHHRLLTQEEFGAGFVREKVEAARERGRTRRSATLERTMSL